MSSPIVSSNGIIHVLGYTPAEGECGVPITVRIHFRADLADTMFVRLVIGDKAVPTKVTQLPDVSYGRWQLHAAAPSLDRLQLPSTKILMSVQALNADNAILDSVNFGEFSYWASSSTERRRIDKLPKLEIPEMTIRRSTLNHPSPSSANSDRSPFSKTPAHRIARLQRRIKNQSLTRTKQSNSPFSGQEEFYAQTPILELVTPLSDICTGWKPAEIAAGRRLVRFCKVQDGRKLVVSCEPVLQEDYCETESVISCIYRKETDNCFVTSVDVIYLLERLTNGEFPVEEKNRIRRNLEGLRPTTVSKHKHGFGDFFQRIMDFPGPKPRNIEKDLKVFDWNLLGQALEKILSKYSLYTSSPPDEAEDSPINTPLTADSPELYEMQLSYPLPEDLTPSRFLDTKVNVIKSEEPSVGFCSGSIHPSIQNESGDLDRAFPSPVDSVLTESPSTPSSPIFPHFGGPSISNSEPQSMDAQHPWNTGIPKFEGDEMAVESPFSVYASYDAMTESSTFADNHLDFGIYDSYSYPGISDETLASLVDQYI